LVRGVSFVPKGDPAGRAELKLPPAKTMLPTTACDQTTPLICTVGNPSAVTVAGVPAVGGVGSAWATKVAAGNAIKAAAASTSAHNSATQRVNENERMNIPPEICAPAYGLFS
jgi:hypothetical protein